MKQSIQSHTTPDKESMVMVPMSVKLISALVLMLLVSLTILLQLSLCSKISAGRSRSLDLNYMDAKDVTWPIIERYYLLIKYFEPVCGYEDTEIAKPICWSDKASYRVKFNHTRTLANGLGFCNGTKIPLPDSIYKGLDGNKVINSPVSHLNAIGLIDGVASVQLIKNLDNNKQVGPKMKYDAKLILDDLLYKSASEASVDFFYNYRITPGFFLHKPKILIEKFITTTRLMDLVTRLNVYLSTNVNDRSSFLSLPTRLNAEMESQAHLLMGYYYDPNHDLTLNDMLTAFGLGESDFAQLTRPIYLESCTHEEDRQTITMDFVYKSTQKFSYLLPSDPHSSMGHQQQHQESSVVNSKLHLADKDSDNYQESFIDLAKRRILDIAGIQYE